MMQTKNKVQLAMDEPIPYLLTEKAIRYLRAWRATRLIALHLPRTARN